MRLITFKWLLHVRHRSNLIDEVEQDAKITDVQAGILYPQSVSFTALIRRALFFLGCSAFVVVHVEVLQNEAVSSGEEDL